MPPVLLPVSGTTTPLRTSGVELVPGTSSAFVVAPEDGIVTWSDTTAPRMVKIATATGVEHALSNLSSARPTAAPLVEVGDTVTAGQAIGRANNRTPVRWTIYEATTGRSLDPLAYLHGRREPDDTPGPSTAPAPSSPSSPSSPGPTGPQGPIGPQGPTPPAGPTLPGAPFPYPPQAPLPSWPSGAPVPPVPAPAPAPATSGSSGAGGLLLLAIGALLLADGLASKRGSRR